MNRYARCVVLVCVWAYASTSLSLAQQLEPPSTTVRETITTEDIAARREQAENAPDVEDEIRRAIIELYTSAAAHLERAVVAQKLKAGYAANISSVDERLAKTKSQLIELEDETPSPPEQSTQSYLDQEVLRRQTRLDELRATLSSIEQQITTRPARRREIRSRLAAVQPEIEQLDSEIAADAPTGELPLLTLAKQTNLLALRQQLEVETPTLRDELALYDGEDAVEFLRFSRELATQQIALAEKSLELVTTAAKRVREDTAQETVEKTRNEAATVDPAFHKLADGNNALAEKNRQIAGQVSDAEDTRDKIAKQFDALRRDFDLSNQKVKSVVGLPASLGAVLRKQRSELPNTRELMSEIKQRQQLIDEAQLTWFDLDEQRQQLSADREQLERAISSVRTITPEAKAVLKSQAFDLLTRKQQLLESLLRAEDSYFDVLTDTSIKQQQLVETCHQFATFIDERVLWIRSGPSVFSKAYWQGLRDEKLQTPPLSNIGRLLRDDARQQMLLYVGMALLGLFLLRAGMTLKPVLADLGDEARRGSSTRFLPTVRATLITFVLTLPIPLLVGFVAWRLRSVAGNDELLQSLSRGLFAFAAAFLSLELMRQICRTNGLADAHFQWPASAVSLLRSCFTALVILVPLLVMTIEMLSSGQHKHSGSSVVRLVFIACLVIYAVFFVTLFHPGRGVFAEYLNRHHDGWLFRLRFVWYPLTVAIPLGHVVLAAAGYSYTAKHLAARFYITLSLIVASFVVYSLLMRLVLIQRRRLRIAQAKKRQSAALAEQAGVRQSIVAEDVPLADLRDQSDQTRRFLGIVLVGAILLGFWFTWNNVLPALGFLERWPIWTSTQSISESYTDEAGNLKVRQRDVADPITFADLAFAVLIGVVTLVASQNLPGLLEIAVLQQLPIDNSLRYAISTLGKYLIVLIGLFIAFRTVGLRWNQIQWLATALMFGLAFGLQEMFANFVAGVIILFERPIRVGDIVTVDDVTGTVARVRMRATTITNYDRKDYIVPNRDFITGRVLNWTLSDQVNRIVIPVGVAYGSDKKLVRETLRKIAQDHELVVVNPPAQVTFESFGDSSLSFVLRCYISMRDMPYRLDVIDDLHMRIDDAFRAANIEIAFPQRDLHVRSLPVEVPTLGGTPRQ